MASGVAVLGAAVSVSAWDVRAAPARSYKADHPVLLARMEYVNDKFMGEIQPSG